MGCVKRQENLSLLFPGVAVWIGTFEMVYLGCLRVTVFVPGSVFGNAFAPL